MKFAIANNLKSKVSGKFLPSSLSSLLHWYRIGVGQTLDVNDNINIWTDQKGSNNLTGSGGNDQQPKLIGNAVTFGASDDHLEFETALELSNFSIYIRAEHSSPGDFLTTQVDSGGTDFLKVQSATQARVKINGQRHDYNLSGTISVNTKYSIGFERATNGDISIFLEQGGTIQTSTSTGSGDGNVAISELTDFVEIGRPSNGLKVYEIVILDSELDDENRTKLFAYLENK